MTEQQARPWVYLTNRRRRRGLGLSALAKLAEVSVSHLCMLEKGHRGASPELHARLARVLDVAIDDLIDTAPAVPPQKSARAAS